MPTIVMGNNTEGPRKSVRESGHRLQRNHPKEMESCVKEMLGLMLIAALFTSATVGDESRQLLWTNKHTP